MKLHEHILFWLDSSITIGDGGLLWNIRYLGGLLFLPCALVSGIWIDDATIRNASIITGLVLCVPWTALVIHRYRKKKESWVEPSGFVERNGGY